MCFKNMLNLEEKLCKDTQVSSVPPNTNLIDGISFSKFRDEINVLWYEIGNAIKSIPKANTSRLF